MAAVTTRLRGTQAQRSTSEELARLAEGLRLARNGGFALLSYDGIEQRTQWLEALRARLGAVEFYSLPLPGDGVGLVPLIAEVSTRSGFATQPLTVLVVGGIEALEADARERLILNLNLMRNRLAEVAYPLLFCADSAVLDRFVQDAPDLFDRIGLWVDLRGQAPPAVAPRPSLSVEEQYRATLSRRERLVEFRGILSINKPVTLPLVDFYVPRQASQTVTIESLESLVPPTDFPLQRSGRLGRKNEAGGSHPTPAFHPVERRRETRTLAVTDAVRNNRALVVLGDPGAGKSTLLRYLALAAAEGQPERAGLPHDGGWLPLLVPCVAYGLALQTTPGLPLLDFIGDYLAQQYGIADLSRTVQAALDANRALLLFDGLDEVHDSQRAAVVIAIGDFLRAWCRALPQSNRAVISSRIVGYGAASIYSADAVVTLRDFEDAQITQFLRGWCVAYERFARGDSPEAERDGIERAEALAAEIRGNGGARRLAGNPLLLTIMALIQRQGVKLPERRVELYDIAVRTLIETWNRARSLSGVALLNLPDPRLTAALLGDLALWMQDRGVVTAGAAELLPALAEAQRRHGALEPEAAAAAFLHDVQHYSGLLVERGPDAYSFLHLTFQEYFAARALADMADAEARWRIVEPHLHDPRWRETILLTAGELGVMKRREAEVTDLVRRILSATLEPSHLAIWLFKRRWWRLLSTPQVDQIEEHHLRRNLLLAGQVVADEPGVELSLARQITDSLVDLSLSSIRAQCNDVGELLEHLPEHLRIHSAQKLTVMLQDSTPQKREAAARALGRLGKAALPAVNLLLAIAQNSPLKYRTFSKDLIGSTYSRSPELDVSNAAISALGHLEASTSGVLNNLGDTVDYHLKQEIKEASIFALQQSDKLISTDIDWLTSLLDDPKELRWSAAAQALRTLGAANLIVNQLLKDLEISYYDNYRNHTYIVEKLGRLGFPTSAVIEALLHTLHDHNSEDYVRAKAVWALGRLGIITQVVINELVQALGDSSGRVRAMAADALGNLGDTTSNVIDTLLEILHDPDMYVRIKAAIALGRLSIGKPLVVELLLAFFRNKNEGFFNDKIRAELVLQTLASNGANHELVDDLLIALRDPIDRVRGVAAKALASINPAPTEIIDALLSALSNETNLAIWCDIILALSKLGVTAPFVVKSLLTIITDYYQFGPALDFVVSDAVEALGRLNIRTREVRLWLLTLLADHRGAYYCYKSYYALMGQTDRPGRSW